jgi:hypothetical protein
MTTATASHRGAFAVKDASPDFKILAPARLWARKLMIETQNSDSLKTLRSIESRRKNPIGWGAQKGNLVANAYQLFGRSLHYLE